MPPALRPWIRAAVSSFQGVRRAVWFVTRPASRGVHAVPITPRGEIVLVRLTYARGWRLPGGGLKRGEEPVPALLRELREEIGLRSHGAVEPLGEFHHEPDYRRSVAQVFRVRDVAFAPPRWSLEVEEARAFAPQDLPPDLPEVTAAQLRMAGLLPPR
ncbi:NUDIX domain-containing protein [Rubellimicrobium aerolatum]|uniref:NUDIX domain-containing protein n=1 Tax=Rubellimicrobium aerolatum TaxID=490979 RepID=A0ABW0S8P0_9RHOB|nr:NUDIX domain-containing protein [Rubellimicrobium aerolatum]MBP1804658.1 8-oxo-dGTP pyrophosphatase MutT (NUDIX family) [Rubellimicrobium aerolatum]